MKTAAENSERVKSGVTRKRIYSLLPFREYRICIGLGRMAPPDFDKMSKLVAELEAMCERAKELRAELEGARKQGRFWRGSHDVKKASTPAVELSKAADRKAHPK